jgi:hypothetical protein
VLECMHICQIFWWMYKIMLNLLKKREGEEKEENKWVRYEIKLIN